MTYSNRLKWFRSWPRVEEGIEDRARVQDGLPRLHIKLHDLATDPKVYAIGSFAMLEWDVAISLGDLQRFESHVLKEPNRVHVAPYILYPTSTGLTKSVWAHRVGKEPRSRWITTNEPFADQVGHGCIYFPSNILKRFFEEVPRRDETTYFTDCGFSIWHSEAVGPIPVHWDVRPVHLHY